MRERIKEILLESIQVKEELLRDKVSSILEIAQAAIESLKKNGKVILLSTAGDEIAPGKGAVAEIVCDKPSAANLSEVKIVGKKQ